MWSWVDLVTKVNKVFVQPGERIKSYEPVEFG